METRRRTVAKAIGWQMLGLAVMALVGALLTGSVVLGGTLAVVNATLGFVLYVAYERVWAHVRWGRW